MKALFIKELISTVKCNKIAIIIIPIFAAVGILNKQYMFILILPALLSMLPLSQMTYDEQSQWDRYVQCMPVDKKKIVSSKYAMVIALSAVSALIIGIITTALSTKTRTGMNEVLFMIACSLLIGVAVPSISIPINLKFGTAKGRIIYLILVGGICGLIPAILTSNSAKLSEIMTKFFSNTALFCTASVGAFAVILLISWFISIKIYEAKEV